MNVPEWVRLTVRDMIDKRTGNVTARVTGVPRRSLYRVVAGISVSRVTIERLESSLRSGTTGTKQQA